MMDSTNPETWNDIGEHPYVKTHRLAIDFYDRDHVADLASLRKITAKVLSSFTGVTCELVVLDDFTFYVDFRLPWLRPFRVYPSYENERGYYARIDDEANEEFETESDLLDCLLRLIDQSK